MMVTSLQGRSLVEASHQKWPGLTFEMYDRVLRRRAFNGQALVTKLSL